MLEVFGFFPTSAWHLIFPILAIILWLFSFGVAKKRGVLRFYKSALAVSFWEEILFRGFIFAFILQATQNLILAVAISSLLFGVFHLRNLWWADWKRVLRMCLYTGLIVGPVLSLIRVETGDIYLGIFLHFLNNFLVVFPLPFLKSFMQEVPRDTFLAMKRQHEK